MDSMGLKICIVSEAIEKPFDEGFKIFVYNLIKELSKHFTVLGLSRSGSFEGGIEKFCTKALPKNKLLLSLHLWRKIKIFKPDLIYYIPTACATVFGLLRAKILKFYCNSAQTVMITLQPREYNAISKKIIPFIVPDLVLAQSLKTHKVLSSLGCKVKVIATGVDLQKFTPVNKKVKESLRKKHGFPSNKFIVLHVGHINRNRNAQIMKAIQGINGVQTIIVGSTSYPEDRYLVAELKKANVIVINSYIENIEEIYQSADCYLFPVFSEGACTEIPLSVFEAMACNLSIVSTKFRGLPHVIKNQDDFAYVNTVVDVIPKIKSIKQVTRPHRPQTRKMIESYSWENVIKQVVSYSVV